MNSRAHRSAALALACFAIVLAALVALHFLRADLSPRSHRLSEYAVGPYGGLMTLAFLASAIGLLAFARAFGGLAPAGPWLGATRAALVAAALANALMALFPATPWTEGRPVTTTLGSVGWLHDRLAVFHAACWGTIVVTTPIAWARDPNRRGLALGSALASAIVLSGLVVRSFAPPDAIGLTQRTWVAGVLAWALYHGLALRAQAS